MTIKIEALRRVFRARQRIRDQAATEVSVAQQLENERKTSSELAAARRSELIAGCEDRLKVATSVTELELLANDMAAAEQEVTQSQVKLTEATNTRERHAEVLRRKERDLRIAEKAVGEKMAQRQKLNERVEQSLSDDLAARRGQGQS